MPGEELFRSYREAGQAGPGQETQESEAMIRMIVKIEEQNPGQIAMGVVHEPVDPTEFESYCTTMLDTALEVATNELLKYIGGGTTVTVKDKKRGKEIRDFIDDNGENPKRYKDWEEPGK